MYKYKIVIKGEEENGKQKIDEFRANNDEEVVSLYKVMGKTIKIVDKVHIKDTPKDQKPIQKSSAPTQPVKDKNTIKYFTNNDIKFKIENSKLYIKEWIDVTNDKLFKIENNKIFHKLWKEINAD